ncbi:MAG: hypothetical protein JXA14_12845 [Anaerolineae bacterium]|jgi:hypothetical protein|nr:hypothetical protein [Anaerolineae bacterium]
MRKTIERKKLLFAINRVLIVLAIAAILGGLLLNQWHDVWIKAILL